LQNFSLFGIDNQIVGVQMPQFRGGTTEKEKGGQENGPKQNATTSETTCNVDASSNISDAELTKLMQTFSTLTSYEQVLGLPMRASFEHRSSTGF